MKIFSLYNTLQGKRFDSGECTLWNAMPPPSKHSRVFAFSSVSSGASLIISLYKYFLSSTTMKLDLTVALNLLLLAYAASALKSLICLCRHCVRSSLIYTRSQSLRPCRFLRCLNTCILSDNSLNPTTIGLGRLTTRLFVFSAPSSGCLLWPAVLSPCDRSCRRPAC